MHWQLRKWHSALWIFAVTAPFAAIFAWVSDWRIFLLWIFMWQFNLWRRRWWRHIAVLCAMLFVAVVSHWLLHAPSAVFFMSLVLLFAASEFCDCDGRISPFGFIGVIFPALSILAIAQNIVLFVVLVGLMICFSLVFIARYNHMAVRAIRLRLLPLAVAVGAVFLVATISFILIPRIEFPSVAGLNTGFVLQTRSGVPEDLNLNNFGTLFDNTDVMFRAYMDKPLPLGITPYWRVYVLDRATPQGWYRSHQATYQYQNNMPRHARVKIWHPNTLTHKAYPTLGVSVAHTLVAHPLLQFSDTGEIIVRDAQTPFPQTLTLDVNLDDNFAANIPSIRKTHGAPKLSVWARELRAKSSHRREFVQKLMRHFATQNYHYTLSPPTLAGGSMLDDFFFRTRAGYCSHYALALANALRAGGIAANVVTGYAGGAWNRYGRYYLVRASDAHAWVEAELSPGIWTRLDATHVLRAHVDTQNVTHNEVVQSPLALFFISGRERIDAFLTMLNNEIVLYDAAARRDFLQSAWTKFLFVVLGGIMLFITYILYIRLAHKLHRHAYFVRLGICFERLAYRSGYRRRASHQGWLAFAQGWALEKPHAADTILAFAAEYCRLAFGRTPPQNDDYTRLRMMLGRIKAQK